MLKKTIEYVDYDGTPRKEDYYFNLSKAEVVEMEMGINGGMTKLLEKIVKEKDFKRIVESFKNIVKMSYGEKSPDGKYFIKKRDGVNLADMFEQSEAYSVLFMELASDADAAAAFLKGVLPDVPEEALKEAQAETAKIAAMPAT
jgi:hypothetical protein